MRSSSGYASIWCIFFHQLQPRDPMAPITRGLPNDATYHRFAEWALVICMTDYYAPTLGLTHAI